MDAALHKPKATSFAYGTEHQQQMLEYYHASKTDGAERLRVELAHHLVNTYALPRINKPAAETTVVDIGCSVGLFAIEFAKRGFRSVGIDFDPAALEIANQLAADEGVTAQFMQSDVADLDLEFPIDIALCFDIFEHLHDDELGAMLFSIKRKLSPQGCLVFHTLPQEYDYMFWREHIHGIRFPRLLRPFRKMKPEKFTRLVRAYACWRDIERFARGWGSYKEGIKHEGHCNPLTVDRLRDILSRAGYEIPFVETGFLGDSQLDPRDREHFHNQPITHRSLRGVAVLKD